MRIFAAVSNTFFPVYFQRYGRCSAGFSFLSLCFRKEITMCSMKLEYLVNEKVTAPIWRRVNTAQRAKMRPVLSHLLQGVISFPFPPAPHTYGILHNNPLCSSFDASLSCRFLSRPCTLHIFTRTPCNILSFQFILASISPVFILFFYSSIIHVLMHKAWYVRM